MEVTIKVNYEYTNNAFLAKDILANLPSTFAADFEVANKYTKEEKEEFAHILETSTNKLERIEAQAKLNSDPLGHPSHNEITHLSVAWSPSDAYVFIVNNRSMLNVILNFLVTTKSKQIWHNLSYDGRYIKYHTGKFPINYEDTQILAKTLVNHVEVHKANTGLKQLAGHKYGAWGISSDNFTKEQMFEEKMLKYAATDACATYWLWQSIEENLK